MTSNDNRLTDNKLDKTFDNASFDHPVTVHDRRIMKQLWKEYIKNKKASPTDGVEDAGKE
ncbi:conserved domain protein [Limosilactobacillus oris F0423]|uniref:Conserved domain protein n=1 Tax=Limosilactobacillus oris F0423 TaxID=944562 RepID=A0ABP2LAG9_9LACO|nr:hypothetical protein [Limosilactobacillus oris]EGS37977.1 conserved domain protein [Limosilactobacillus oris F0423]